MESLVPDILSKVTPDMLEVKFGELKAEPGNVLTPKDVKKEPRLIWPGADNNAYYVAAMIDPDDPNGKEPKMKEWMHWLVGNIPGTNVHNGTVLNDYVGSAPPKGSGLHRYILLVYEQKKFKDCW